MEVGTTNVGNENLAIKAPEQPEQKAKHSKLPIILAIIFAAIAVIATIIVIIVFNQSVEPSEIPTPSAPIEDIEEVPSYVILDDYDTSAELEEFVKTKHIITSYAELQKLYDNIGAYYATSYPLSIDYETDESESYIEPTEPAEYTPLNKPEELNEGFFVEHDLIVVGYESYACGGGFNRVRSVSKNGKEIVTEIGYNGSCGMCAPEFLIILVEVEKDFTSDSDTFVVKSTRENSLDCDPTVLY